MDQTSSPFIRVVLPTYNRASLVVGAIESVLAQSYSNFEIIVSNDGSKDETATVVQRMAAQDSRITLITNPNGGLPVSRNRALAVPGTYDFVSFLDDDDRWVHTHLEESLALFQVAPQLDCVFAKVQSNDLTGRWTNEKFKEREERMNRPKFLASDNLGHGQYVLEPGVMWQGIARNEFGIHPSTVIVRHRAVGRSFWFDPSMWFFEDLEFFLYLIRSGCHFGFIDKAHVDVYYQGDNASGGLLPLTSPKLARNYEKVVQVRQMILENSEDPQDRAIARKVLNVTAYLLGQCYAAQGFKKKAQQSYIQAIKSYPTWPACKGFALSLLPDGIWNGLRELRA